LRDLAVDGCGVYLELRPLVLRLWQTLFVTPSRSTVRIVGAVEGSRLWEVDDGFPGT